MQKLEYTLQEIREKREEANRKMQRYPAGEALTAYHEGQTEAYETCMEMLERLLKAYQKPQRATTGVLIEPSAAEIRAGITT